MCPRAFRACLHHSTMLDAMDSKTKNAETYREVARIHAECINQGFLSTLGGRFLSFLYEAIDSDPNSILLVEHAKGNVVGFVAGGRGINQIYRQMFRRWPRLIWTLLPALLNPLKVKRILEIVWFTRKRKPIPGSPKAELFSIAVVDQFRGQGVAEELYLALAQWFVQHGESAFCIVVGEGLAPAHCFYQKMGAVPMAEIAVHPEQRSTLYRQNLTIGK